MVKYNTIRRRNNIGSVNMDDIKKTATDSSAEETGADITPEVSADEREKLAEKPAMEMNGTAAEMDSLGKSEAEKKRAASLELYDWIQSIVSTLVIVILAFIFIGRQTGVLGTSMRDTLHNNDSVFITSLFYTPKNGDIVIIKTDAFAETLLIKRVIAVEGQTIDINFETNEVFVDGVVINEPYIREPTRERLNFNGEVTVPEGCVFVMGDNRNASRDSRDDAVGFVDVRNIIGKAHFIIFPGKEKNSSEPRDWSRLGSVYKNLP